MEPSDKNLWEESPLRKLAERSLEKPGMYLIALRAHINRGKAMVGDLLQDVADAFPKPASAKPFEDSKA